MYKLPTHNLNYAYHFGVIYKLRLQTGKRKEKIFTKRVITAWQLSNKEIAVLGDAWRAELVEGFNKLFDHPQIKQEYFEVEFSVVDQNGNFLATREN